MTILDDALTLLGETRTRGHAHMSFRGLFLEPDELAQLPRGLQPPRDAAPSTPSSPVRKVVQAKHLADAEVLAVLTTNWALTCEVAAHFSHLPFKVVLAKLRQLHRRGLVHGCPCGCRGDWHLPDTCPPGAY